MAAKPATPTEVKSEPTADEGTTQYLGGKKVRHRFNWRAADGQPKNSKTVVFDFSRCTEQVLLDYALDSVVIKVQALLRNAALAHPQMKVDPKLFDVVDVAELATATASKADPKSQMLLSMRKAGMSDEMIAAAAKAYDERVKK